MRLPVILVVALFSASNSHGEETAKAITIPLDQVWGLGMPGTINLEQLNRDDVDLSLIAQIRHSLANVPASGKSASPGFAVSGTAREALERAHAVLVNGKSFKQSFSKSSELWIVFFSYQSGQYVQLYRIKRRGKEVSILFRFVPHETAVVTEHLALIPLGKLPPGKYITNVVQSPMEEKYIAMGFASPETSDALRLVCGSFEFSVTD